MHIIPGLPPAITLETYASLAGMLPPPIIDTEEACATRDDTAMRAVADLGPTSAFEARLAADVIAADAHAKDCLRLAAKYFNDVAAASRCRAQFAVMMRQMHSALRTLQQIQAARQKAGATLLPGEDRPTQPAALPLEEVHPARDPAFPDPPSQPHPPSAAEDDTPAHSPAVPIDADGAMAPAAAGSGQSIDPAILDSIVNSPNPFGTGQRHHLAGGVSHHAAQSHTTAS